MRKLCTLFLLPVLVGCSSSGDGKSAEPAPHAAPAAGMGRIYFFRTNRAVSKAIQPAVRLNGEPVGNSRPGKYFYVDRAPGSYQVTCSVVTDHTINFPLKGGETIYVETRATMGIYVGHVRPSIVSADKGKAGVAKCAYAGSG
jgi:hypothetical protein